jgi:hypothetical protein
LSPIFERVFVSAGKNKYLRVSRVRKKQTFVSELAKYYLSWVVWLLNFFYILLKRASFCQNLLVAE